jgi:uncharacterized protein (DUF983 family)
VADASAKISGYTGKMHEPDPNIQRWPPPGLLPPAAHAMPGWGTIIWRGMRGICPRCGLAPIFQGYLKVRPVCARCAAPLGDMPADDAPPYIAMVVVLQLLALFVVCFFKGIYRPGLFAGSLWLILLAGICMVALRLAKGAVIGILLKLGLKREVLNG